MSMHYAGEHGIGMYLNPDEADTFCEAYVKKHGVDELKPSEIEDEELEEAKEDVPIELGATVLDDDHCDMRIIWHLDGKTCGGSDDDFVDGLFLYAEKQGAFFETNTRDLYKDIGEMAEEFRDHFGQYLPEGFDYESHMCEYLGTNFG